MSPKMAIGHKFMKNGVLYEVRMVHVAPNGDVSYTAIPYHASAKNLNLDPIMVKESEIA